MKNFLKKYLSEEALKEVEQKYLAQNGEAKGLPIYAGKAELDAALAEKKTAEEALKSAQDAHAKALKDAVKAARDEEIGKKDSELSLLRRDLEVTEVIYKNKGRNVKAIKALVDPEKDIQQEIARLQKEESYLFEGKQVDFPAGTGKNGPGENSGNDAKEVASMRMAVGL